MNIIDIINKKAAGKELSEQEIYFFVNEYTKKTGKVADYQAASLLMAIKLNGMIFD